jgi:sucrose-6-phosphate hydrolase SacC (GH32 family)
MAILVFHPDLRRLAGALTYVRALPLSFHDDDIHLRRGRLAMQPSNSAMKCDRKQEGAAKQLLKKQLHKKMSSHSGMIIVEKFALSAVQTQQFSLRLKQSCCKHRPSISS